jgi:hypothetical protein
MPCNRSRPVVTVLYFIGVEFSASSITLAGSYLSGVRCCPGSVPRSTFFNQLLEHNVKQVQSTVYIVPLFPAEQPTSIGASRPFRQNIRLFQKQMDVTEKLIVNHSPGIFFPSFDDT